MGNSTKLGKILELRVPNLMPDFERTTTIAKLVSARGEIEDLLARQAKRHTSGRTLLNLKERHSLREVIKVLDDIVLRLEQQKTSETQKGRVV
jgi:hypothetical protein